MTAPKWHEGRCSIDGCDKPVRARGWCEAHYRRWKRHGDPLAGRRAPAPGPCSVVGCERPSKGRGLCKLHLSREVRTGDVGPAEVLRIARRTYEVGERYGRLVVAVRREPPEAKVTCLCDCGTEVAVSVGDLGRSTFSCGCLKLGETNPNWRGGITQHPLHEVYYAMLGRCHNPNNPRYADYGGRGITVCDEWRDDFWTFVADMGERPGGVGPTGRAEYSLDRVDNDRGYEPGNVRWATDVEQRANQRRVVAS